MQWQPSVIGHSRGLKYARFTSHVPSVLTSENGANLQSDADCTCNLARNVIIVRICCKISNIPKTSQIQSVELMEGSNGILALKMRFCDFRTSKVVQLGERIHSIGICIIFIDLDSDLLNSCTYTNGDKADRQWWCRVIHSSRSRAFRRYICHSFDGSNGWSYTFSGNKIHRQL